MGKVYVIKDQDGGYASDRAFTLTDDGWIYSYYTGDDTGFTFYTERSAAEKDLARLNEIVKKYNFNKQFYIEYIDFSTIKQGNKIFEML